MTAAEAASVKRGLQDLMGLSIDAFAKTRRRSAQGKVLRGASKFTKVNSGTSSSSRALAGAWIV